MMVSGLIYQVTESCRQLLLLIWPSSSCTLQHGRDVLNDLEQQLRHCPVERQRSGFLSANPQGVNILLQLKLEELQIIRSDIPLAFQGTKSHSSWI
jgi:hypothetical protein